MEKFGSHFLFRLPGQESTHFGVGFSTLAPATIPAPNGGTLYFCEALVYRMAVSCGAHHAHCEHVFVGPAGAEKYCLARMMELTEKFCEAMTKENDVHADVEWPTDAVWKPLHIHVTPLIITHTPGPVPQYPLDDPFRDLDWDAI